jgi:hypothetical protein
MNRASLRDLNGVNQAAPVGCRLTASALRLAAVLVRFHDSAQRIPTTQQALSSKAKPPHHRRAGNAADTSVAPVAAEIGTIAQFSGVA